MTSVVLRGAGVAGSVYGATARLLGWHVLSVGSRSAESAKALGADVHAAGTHTFSDPPGTPLRPDLTIVATPPTDHIRVLAGPESSGELLIIAPLASTLSEADRLVDRASTVGGMLGWPLITAPTTQEMMRRLTTIGDPTSVRMSTSRPTPQWGAYATGRWGGGVTLFAAHDQLALTLLVARLLGLGAPTSVTGRMELSAAGVDISAAVTLGFDSGFSAETTAEWTDAATPRSEIEVAGDMGVLRIDGNPEPSLENDGDVVAVRRGALGHERFRPLYDAGVVDLLRLVDAGRVSNQPIPHALTFGFGREIVEVISAAYMSAGRHEPVPLPFAGPRDRTPLGHFHHPA